MSTDFPPIYGTLTRAGTMAVSDEPAVTGLLVEMSILELRAIRRLPMYQRVAILPAELVDNDVVLAKDYDATHAALRALRSACRNHLPPGAYASLDTALAAADAILRPPFPANDLRGEHNAEHNESTTQSTKLMTPCATT
jgi:hypothetical protein